MCGIAGAIGEFSKAKGEESIKKMLSVIEHRGPDSNGHWSKDGFTFGMQRLSIIDLTGGDQPIWTDDGVGIVFNGEIYNFKKIRSELEKSGIAFKTHSDTEVILHLYRKEGIESIKKLEGMFGICLYDPRNEKVFLIRDRLGKKPLYFLQNEGIFSFGSEIKSLTSVLDSLLPIDTDSVGHFLSLRYVPSPKTIWKGIRKLSPGHYLEYDLKKNTYKEIQYWNFEFKSQKLKSNVDYVKQFEDLFLSAVEKRLLASDVPVGILLSGGLDSSCVAAAALELGHKNFHTFSIGFDDGGNFNELNYAEQASTFIGSKHHEITIGKKEFLNFLEDFIWYADEPMADLASIPLYYVSKLAREHVKVVLSGEGADEILAGYNLDEHARNLHRLKLLSYLPNSLLKLVPSSSIQTLSKTGYPNFLRDRATHITSVFSEEEKKKLFKFEFPSTIDYIKNLYSHSSSLEPIDQLQQAYTESWLVEDLLMKADKMTMATSLELRVPFLDHKLVEWATRLPLEWKVGSSKSGFTTKRILRDFAKKRIPKEIIDRPKQGFPVPAYKWIMEDPSLAASLINNTNLDQFIHLDRLDNYYKQLSEGSIVAAHKLWNLMILGTWLKRANR